MKGILSLAIWILLFIGVVAGQEDSFFEAIKERVDNSEFKNIEIDNLNNIPNSFDEADRILNDGELQRRIMWDHVGKTFVIMDIGINGNFIAQLYFSIEGNLIHSKGNIWGVIHPNGSFFGFVNLPINEGYFWGEFSLNNTWWVRNNHNGIMIGEYLDKSALPSANVLVNLNVSGPIKNAGDTFEATVTLENIGSTRAFDVFASLKNIPSGWQVSPLNMQEFGIVYPGASIKRSFNVTRDEEDSEIFAIVDGLNIDPISSNIIRVPIFPIVLVASLFGMFIAYLLYRRK